MLAAALMLSSLLGASFGGPSGGGRAPAAPTLADSFPEQWAYVQSDALFNAVCCSRRAGKTVGAVKRTVARMAAKPGARVHYVTLIRRNCRKYFWWPLQAELQRLGWRFEANESDLILKVENGSWVQAIGVDDIAGVKAVKGDRTDLFMIDEAQENADEIMRSLVDVAATPMLTDTGGMLDLLGTVPEAEPTYFSEALDSPGWEHFHWTMFDHDYPESRQVKRARVQEIIEKRGLTWDHPIIAREYLGQRVRDPSKLAYEFDGKRNVYEAQDFAGATWRHSLGIDIGFQDRDALVVLAWRTDDPEHRLYVRHTWQANHQDVDQLSDVVRSVLKEYRISAIVGDHGGHGAVKVMKTLEARLRILIQTKPTDVMVSVGLVNDDLRTGRLLLPKDSELGSDLARVVRSVNPRTKRVEINKTGYHSDLSEALRYAHAAARHYRGKAAAPEKSRDELLWEREQQIFKARRDPLHAANFRRRVL